MTAAEEMLGSKVDDARIAIVGAGPAGSLLALALAQRGYGIDVYERRHDPRAGGEKVGRSINLGLSKRGMQALTMVGLLDTVLQRSVVMGGRVIHAPDSSTRFQAYGNQSNQVLHSTDRNELNHLLLDHAEQHPKVKLHFGHTLIRVDKEQRELQLESPTGIVKCRPKWVVGADGAFSAMRRELQRGMRANYHQEFLEWGYKELTLAPNADGTSPIKLEALHVWPRRHCMIVSHPNRNGSHTLTLFLPFEGEDSFATARTPDDIRALTEKYFPDLVPLLPGLVDEWIKNPIGTLITTRTAPWAFGDWAVLVGDACHAVYPFYGQGMNSSFEDCCVLMNALTESPNDTALAFRTYEERRRPHTDVLCELSKANFVELSSKVQSPWFLARKRLDAVLNRIWPKAWLPLYTMIAHSTMPYGAAVARARRQDRILLSSVLGGLVLISIVVTMMFWRR